MGYMKTIFAPFATNLYYKKHLRGEAWKAAISKEFDIDREHPGNEEWLDSQLKALKEDKELYRNIGNQ